MNLKSSSLKEKIGHLIAKKLSSLIKAQVCGLFFSNLKELEVATFMHLKILHKNSLMVQKTLRSTYKMKLQTLKNANLKTCFWNFWEARASIWPDVAWFGSLGKLEFILVTWKQLTSARQWVSLAQVTWLAVQKFTHTLKTVWLGWTLA